MQRERDLSDPVATPDERAPSECCELLLDLLGYELFRGHLTIETGEALRKHLDECPCCLEKMTSYYELVGLNRACLKVM